MSDISKQGQMIAGHNEQGNVIQKFRRKSSKYMKIMSISLSDSLVYVFDFVGRSIFFFVIMLIFLYLWSAIFSGDGTKIDGFTLESMIWYLLVTETIALSGSRYYAEISRDVKTGNVAYMLNKPYNYVIYQFANQFAKVLLNLVKHGILAVIIGLLYVGPLLGFKLISLPMIIMAVLLGSAIDFFINFALALTAFWVEENMPFRWIYQKLVFVLGGMLLPIDMFPGMVKDIARWLPFSYVTYAPAKLAVDFSVGNFLSVFAIQIVYLLIAIGVALLVFKKGMKGVSVNGG